MDTISANQKPKNKSTELDFGFNFGMGAEHKMRGQQNIFKNMSLKYEFIYVAVEHNYRPLIRLGLTYPL
jgi:hypothetical protein